MPTKAQFKTLMADASAYVEDYRVQNIDPAHRRADHSYHGILENQQDYIDRGRSMLFIPKTRDHVRRWTTTITNAFYQSDDIVTVEYGIDEARERFTNEVVNRRLEGQTSFYRWLTGAAHTHCKTGNAVGKTGWEYEEREDRSSYDDPETGEEIEQITVSPVRDKPFFELVPFEQVQIDYRCTSTDPVQDSPFFRQWIPMYVTDVQDKFDRKEWKKPRGIDWDKLSNGPSSLETVRTARQGSMADPTQRNIGSASDGPALSYRQIWVVENYFRSGGTDWTFISLGDEHIVTEPERVTDKFVHRKRPFALSQYDPEAFRVYSDGIPEMFKGLQAEMNAIRNQRRDNVNIILNKNLLVKRGSGIQLASLINSRPNAITMGDRIGEEDVRYIPTPDVTGSSYREEEIAAADIEESSGQSRNTMGVNAPDRQTATASAISASSAGEIESYIIKGFIEGLVRPLLEMFYDNVVAMESDPDVLAFAAANTGLPPDETLLVRGELVINAGMGSTNKELKAAKLERSLDRCIQLAPVAPQFIKAAEEIMRDLLPLNGAKNIDRYLPPTQGQQAVGAAGIPPGESAVPPAAETAAPFNPGIPPALSALTASTPNMGGFARGLMM